MIRNHTPGSADKDRARCLGPSGHRAASGTAFSCRPSCHELSLLHHTPHTGLLSFGWRLKNSSGLDESDVAIRLLDDCSVISKDRHFQLHVVLHTTFAIITCTSLALAAMTVKVRLSWWTLAAAHGARYAVVGEFDKAKDQSENLRGRGGNGQTRRLYGGMSHDQGSWRGSIFTIGTKRRRLDGESERRYCAPINKPERGDTRTHTQPDRLFSFSLSLHSMLCVCPSAY